MHTAAPSRHRQYEGGSGSPAESDPAGDEQHPAPIPNALPVMMHEDAAAADHPGPAS